MLIFDLNSLVHPVLQRRMIANDRNEHYDFNNYRNFEMLNYQSERRK